MVPSRILSRARVLIALSLFAALALPLFAHAHEVYVLTPDTIAGEMATSGPSVIGAISSNAFQFFAWGFLTLLIIVFVFFISISHKLEHVLDPMLFAIKRRWGLLIGRVAIGLSLMASGYYGGLFGPELPLHSLVGGFAGAFRIILIVAGLAIAIGFFTRYAAIVALAASVPAIFFYGTYMFTYAYYYVELFVIAALGQHLLSIDRTLMQWHGPIRSVARFVEKYSFLLIRVSFGFALIFASFYAKLIHSGLAFTVVEQYQLTSYFHFNPAFLVLGAFLIEALLGLFFLIGFEVRFASIFFMIFMGLSISFFGEAVWPHIILFGTAAALFVHGYDRYTVEGYFFKDARHEPVL